MPELAHQRVSHEGAAPKQWLFFLHGIFGMGTNFRSVAKTLVARMPDWGVVLCDLRGHGASQGFAPPHTLASAAADVEALSSATGLEISGIAGHSFGGKVALALLQARSQPVEVALVLDSMPGVRVASAERGDPMEVLAELESLPSPLPSREFFRERMSAHGYSQPLVDWLMMNVRPDAGAYRLRLDLPAIRAMLADYFATDLWPVVESGRAARRMCVVVGGRSNVYDEAARERLTKAARAQPNLRAHVLEHAGHWVHVDDAEGLVTVMGESMASP
jgi:esterase